MKTQFIIDDSGKKLGVILPIKEYNRMLEELDELKGVKLYDEAKKGDDGERITLEEAFTKIGDNRKNKK